MSSIRGRHNPIDRAERFNDELDARRDDDARRAWDAPRSPGDRAWGVLPSTLPGNPDLPRLRPLDWDNKIERVAREEGAEAAEKYARALVENFHASGDWETANHIYQKLTQKAYRKSGSYFFRGQSVPRAAWDRAQRIVNARQTSQPPAPIVRRPPIMADAVAGRIAREAVNGARQIARDELVRAVGAIRGAIADPEERAARVELAVAGGNAVLAAMDGHAVRSNVAAALRAEIERAAAGGRVVPDGELAKRAVELTRAFAAAQLSGSRHLAAHPAQPGGKPGSPAWPALDRATGIRDAADEARHRAEAFPGVHPNWMTPGHLLPHAAGPGLGQVAPPRPIGPQATVAELERQIEHELSLVNAWPGSTSVQVQDARRRLTALRRRVQQLQAGRTPQPGRDSRLSQTAGQSVETVHERLLAAAEREAGLLRDAQAMTTGVGVWQALEASADEAARLAAARLGIVPVRVPVPQHGLVATPRTAQAAQVIRGRQQALARYMSQPINVNGGMGNSAYDGTVGSLFGLSSGNRGANLMGPAYNHARAEAAKRFIAQEGLDRDPAFAGDLQSLIRATTQVMGYYRQMSPFHTPSDGVEGRGSGGYSRPTEEAALRNLTAGNATQLERLAALERARELGQISWRQYHSARQQLARQGLLTRETLRLHGARERVGYHAGPGGAAYGLQQSLAEAASLAGHDPDNLVDEQDSDLALMSSHHGGVTGSAKDEAELDRRHDFTYRQLGFARRVSDERLRTLRETVPALQAQAAAARAGGDHEKATRLETAARQALLDLDAQPILGRGGLGAYAYPFGRPAERGQFGNPKAIRFDVDAAYRRFEALAYAMQAWEARDAEKGGTGLRQRVMREWEIQHEQGALPRPNRQGVFHTRWGDLTSAYRTFQDWRWTFDKDGGRKDGSRVGWQEIEAEARKSAGIGADAPLAAHHFLRPAYERLATAIMATDRDEVNRLIRNAADADRVEDTLYLMGLNPEFGRYAPQTSPAQLGTPGMRALETYRRLERGARSMMGAEHAERLATRQQVGGVQIPFNPLVAVALRYEPFWERGRHRYFPEAWTRGSGAFRTAPFSSSGAGRYAVEQMWREAPDAFGTGMDVSELVSLARERAELIPEVERDRLMGRPMHEVLLELFPGELQEFAATVGLPEVGASTTRFPGERVAALQYGNFLRRTHKGFSSRTLLDQSRRTSCLEHLKALREAAPWTGQDTFTQDRLVRNVGRLGMYLFMAADEPFSRDGEAANAAFQEGRLRFGLGRAGAGRWAGRNPALIQRKDLEESKRDRLFRLWHTFSGAADFVHDAQAGTILGGAAESAPLGLLDDDLLGDAFLKPGEDPSGLHEVQRDAILQMRREQRADFAHVTLDEATPDLAAYLRGHQVVHHPAIDAGFAYGITTTGPPYADREGAILNRLELSAVLNAAWETVANLGPATTGEKLGGVATVAGSQARQTKSLSQWLRYNSAAQTDAREGLGTVQAAIAGRAAGDAGRGIGLRGLQTKRQARAFAAAYFPLLRSYRDQAARGGAIGFRRQDLQALSGALGWDSPGFFVGAGTAGPRQWLAQAPAWVEHGLAVGPDHVLRSSHEPSKGYVDHHRAWGVSRAVGGDRARAYGRDELRDLHAAYFDADREGSALGWLLRDERIADQVGGLGNVRRFDRLEQTMGRHPAPRRLPNTWSREKRAAVGARLARRNRLRDAALHELVLTDREGNVFRHGDEGFSAALAALERKPHVAIVGSRSYPDDGSVDEYVDRLASDVVVVSGGAAGVDTFAEQAARARGLATKIYPADSAAWARRGKRAGFARNAHIAREAHRPGGWLVAFDEEAEHGRPPRDSGTGNTYGLAARKGIHRRTNPWDRLAPALAATAATAAVAAPAPAREPDPAIPGFERLRFFDLGQFGAEGVRPAGRGTELGNPFKKGTRFRGGHLAAGESADLFRQWLVDPDDPRWAEYLGGLGDRARSLAEPLMDREHWEWLRANYRRFKGAVLACPGCGQKGGHKSYCHLRWLDQQFAEWEKQDAEGFAKGTAAKRGTGPARVGEAGPEVIELPDGTLVPVTEETYFPDLPEGTRVYSAGELRLKAGRPGESPEATRSRVEQLKLALEKGHVPLGAERFFAGVTSYAEEGISEQHLTVSMLGSRMETQEIDPTALPLHATQHFVMDGHVRHYAEGGGAIHAEGTPVPTLVRFGDKYLVRDGHHRLAAAIANREKIRARVFAYQRPRGGDGAALRASLAGSSGGGLAARLAARGVPGHARGARRLTNWVGLTSDGDDWGSDWHDYAGDEALRLGDLLDEAARIGSPQDEPPRSRAAAAAWFADFAAHAPTINPLRGRLAEGGPETWNAVIRAAAAESAAEFAAFKARFGGEMTGGIESWRRHQADVLEASRRLDEGDAADLGSALARFAADFGLELPADRPAPPSYPPVAAPPAPPAPVLPGYAADPGHPRLGHAPTETFLALYEAVHGRPFVRDDYGTLPAALQRPYAPRGVLAGFPWDEDQRWALGMEHVRGSAPWVLVGPAGAGKTQVEGGLLLRALTERHIEPEEAPMLVAFARRTVETTKNRVQADLERAGISDEVFQRYAASQGVTTAHSLGLSLLRAFGAADVFGRTADGGRFGGGDLGGLLPDDVLMQRPELLDAGDRLRGDIAFEVVDQSDYAREVETFRQAIHELAHDPEGDYRGEPFVQLLQREFEHLLPTIDGRLRTGAGDRNRTKLGLDAGMSEAEKVLWERIQLYEMFGLPKDELLARLDPESDQAVRLPGRGHRGDRRDMLAVLISQRMDEIMGRGTLVNDDRTGRIQVARLLRTSELITKPLEHIRGGADPAWRAKLARLGLAGEHGRQVVMTEGQDIDPATFELLRVLAGDDGNLLVSGDPDQDIYDNKPGGHVMFNRLARAAAKSGTLRQLRDVHRLGAGATEAFEALRQGAVFYDEAQGAYVPLLPAIGLRPGAGAAPGGAPVIAELPAYDGGRRGGELHGYRAIAEMIRHLSGLGASDGANAEERRLADLFPGQVGSHELADWWVVASTNKDVARGVKELSKRGVPVLAQFSEDVLGKWGEMRDLAGRMNLLDEEGNLDAARLRALKQAQTLEQLQLVMSLGRADGELVPMEFVAEIADNVADPAARIGAWSKVDAANWFKVGEAIEEALDFLALPHTENARGIKPEEAVLFSTIHAAKGGQRPRVVVANATEANFKFATAGSEAEARKSMAVFLEGMTRAPWAMAVAAAPTDEERRRYGGRNQAALGLSPLARALQIHGESGALDPLVFGPTAEAITGRAARPASPFPVVAAPATAARRAGTPVRRTWNEGLTEWAKAMGLALAGGGELDRLRHAREGFALVAEAGEPEYVVKGDRAILLDQPTALPLEELFADGGENVRVIPAHKAQSLGRAALGRLTRGLAPDRAFAGGLNDEELAALGIPEGTPEFGGLGFWMDDAAGLGRDAASLFKAAGVEARTMGRTGEDGRRFRRVSLSGAPENLAMARDLFRDLRRADPAFAGAVDAAAAAGLELPGRGSVELGGGLSAFGRLPEQVERFAEQLGKAADTTGYWTEHLELGTKRLGELAKGIESLGLAPGQVGTLKGVGAANAAPPHPLDVMAGRTGDARRAVTPGAATPAREALAGAGGTPLSDRIAALGGEFRTAHGGNVVASLRGAAYGAGEAGRGQRSGWSRFWRGAGEASLAMTYNNVPWIMASTAQNLSQRLDEDIALRGDEGRAQVLAQALTGAVGPAGSPMAAGFAGAYESGLAAGGGYLDRQLGYTRADAARIFGQFSAVGGRYDLTEEERRRLSDPAAGQAERDAIYANVQTRVAGGAEHAAELDRWGTLMGLETGQGGNLVQVMQAQAGIDYDQQSAATDWAMAGMTMTAAANSPFGIQDFVAGYRYIGNTITPYLPTSVPTTAGAAGSALALPAGMRAGGAYDTQTLLAAGVPADQIPEMVRAAETNAIVSILGQNNLTADQGSRGLNQLRDSQFNPNVRQSVQLAQATGMMDSEFRVTDYHTWNPGGGTAFDPARPAAAIDWARYGRDAGYRASVGVTTDPQTLQVAASQIQEDFGIGQETIQLDRMEIQAEQVALTGDQLRLEGQMLQTQLAAMPRMFGLQGGALESSQRLADLRQGEHERQVRAEVGMLPLKQAAFEANQQGQRNDLARAAEGMNLGRWYEDQLYGAPGADQSKTAWIGVARGAQMGASGAELSGLMTAPILGSPVGLENQNAYRGLQHQRSMLVYGQSALFAGAAYEEQMRKLDWDEAYLGQKANLGNQLRSGQRDLQDRDLADSFKQMEANQVLAYAEFRESTTRLLNAAEMLGAERDALEDGQAVERAAYDLQKQMLPLQMEQLRTQIEQNKLAQDDNTLAGAALALSAQELELLHGIHVALEEANDASLAGKGPAVGRTDQGFDAESGRQDFLSWAGSLMDFFADMDPEVRQGAEVIAGDTIAMGPVIRALDDIVGSVIGDTQDILNSPERAQEALAAYLADPNNYRDVGEAASGANAGADAGELSDTASGVRGAWHDVRNSAIVKNTEVILGLTAPLITLASNIAIMTAVLKGFKGGFGGGGFGGGGVYVDADGNPMGGRRRGGGAPTAADVDRGAGGRRGGGGWLGRAGRGLGGFFRGTALPGFVDAGFATFGMADAFGWGGDDLDGSGRARGAGRGGFMRGMGRAAGGALRGAGRFAAGSGLLGMGLGIGGYLADDALAGMGINIGGLLGNVGTFAGMGAMFGPWGMAAGAGVGLGITAWQNREAIGDWAGDHGMGLSDIKGYVQPVIDAFNTIKELDWAKIGEVALDVFSVIFPPFGVLRAIGWERIAEAGKAGYELVKGAFDGVVGFFSEHGGDIIDVATTLLDVAIFPITAPIELLTEHADDIYNGVVGFVEGTVQLVTDPMGWLEEHGADVINGVTGLWGNLTGGIQGAIDWFTEHAGDVLAAGQSIVGWITGLPGQLIAGAAGVAGDIGGFVEDLGVAIVNKVIEFINDIGQAFNEAYPDSLPGPDNPFGTIDPISSFAAGTPWAPGGLALVGELGPELAILPTGAQIKSAHETRMLFAEAAVMERRHAAYGRQGTAISLDPIAARSMAPPRGYPGGGGIHIEKIEVNVAGDDVSAETIARLKAEIGAGVADQLRKIVEDLNY